MGRKINRINKKGKRKMKLLIVVGILTLIFLIIAAGLEEGSKQDYIKENINVGQQFIFEESEYTRMTEQTTELERYKIPVGFLEAIYFTVKNDTIVNVRRGCGLL